MKSRFPTALSRALSVGIFLLFSAHGILAQAAESPTSTTDLYAASSEPQVSSAFADERKSVDLSYHGHYSQARQAVQDQILEKILGQSSRPMRVQNPRLILTGGAMGSGKTTLTQSLSQNGYFKSSEFIHIDPDQIREMIPEFQQWASAGFQDAGTRVQKEVGYLVELLLNRATREGRNILIDSSLKNTEFYSQLLTFIHKTTPQYSTEILFVDAAESTTLLNLAAREQTDLRKTPRELVRLSREGARRSYDELSYHVDRAVRFTSDGKSFRADQILERGILQTIDESPQSFVQLHPFRASTPTDFQVLDSDHWRHVVFDLDWTLINPLQVYSTAPADRIIEIDGIRYQISDDVEEVLGRLSQNPNVRISFFSGGDQSRNLRALKEIKLKDGSGRSLYDLAFRILSKHDLTEKGKTLSSESWSKLVGKDTSKISSHSRNLVLIDDMQTSALNEGNTLWLGRTYDVFETYDDVVRARQAGVRSRYLPASKEEWRAAKKRMLSIEAILNEALEEERLSRSKTSFAQRAIVKGLQRLPFDCIIGFGAIRNPTVKLIPLRSSASR